MLQFPGLCVSAWVTAWVTAQIVKTPAKCRKGMCRSESGVGSTLPSPGNECSVFPRLHFSWTAALGRPLLTNNKLLPIRYLLIDIWLIIWKLLVYTGKSGSGKDLHPVWFFVPGNDAGRVFWRTGGQAASLMFWRGISVCRGGCRSVSVTLPSACVPGSPRGRACSCVTLQCTLNSLLWI